MSTCEMRLLGRAAALLLGAGAFALALFMALPGAAHATSAGWNEAGGCEWTVDGSQLTVEPLNGSGKGVLPEYGSAGDLPWKASAASIKSVKVNAGVSATSCAYLFAGLTNAKAFDLSGLDASAAKDFSYMFSGCSSLQDAAKAGLGSIDFSNATTLSGMFSDCTSLVSADLSVVKAPKLSDLSNLFYNCADLQDVRLSGIETGTLTTLAGMFWGCGKLPAVDIEALDTSRVTAFNHLFAACTSLRYVDAASIDTTSAETFMCMFQHCKSLTHLDVAGWNTKNLTNLRQSFSECSGLRSFDFAKWDLTNVTTAKMMFEADDHLEYVDLSPFRRAKKLGDVYAMFNQCANLKSINVRCMDFSHLDPEGLAHFLDGCKKLETIDMSNMDFGGCIDPVQLFSGCTSLKSANLKNARFPQGVSFLELFSGCTNLKTVDFSGVYAPKTAETNMMFAHCESLETVDFTGATFGTITAAVNMFNSCYSLKSLDLSGIVSGRAKYSLIFYGCYADSYKPMQGFTAAGPKERPSISNATIGKIANVKYNGKYHTPEVSVSVGDNVSYAWGDLWGKELVQGKHYTVSYSNNKKIGTATVTIKGKGIFKGTVKKTFKITA